MPSLEELYTRNISLLQKAGVEYKEFEHEPVLDYETAASIRKRFGLAGSESKNLFLRAKNKGYCMLITLEGKRADLNEVKKAIGTKISIASPDELSEKTGCLPQCAVPFGHDREIILVVDREVLDQQSLIYSPGPPERTIELPGEAIERVLAIVENPVVYI